MRRLPSALALLFLAITLTRVAELSMSLGSGMLGWLFAIGLGAGVFGASYWLKTSDPKLRRAAGSTLGFFVVADLVFNSAEVYRTMRATGALADPILATAGAMYAVFPTAGASLLGWLQGHVDRQPRPPQRHALVPRLRVAIFTWLDGALPREQTLQAHSDAQATLTAQAAAHEALPNPPVTHPARAYACTCGRTLASPQAYAAHKRFCAVQAAHVDAERR